MSNQYKEAVNGVKQLITGVDDPDDIVSALVSAGWSIPNAAHRLVMSKKARYLPKTHSGFVLVALSGKRCSGKDYFAGILGKKLDEIGIQHAQLAISNAIKSTASSFIHEHRIYASNQFQDFIHPFISVSQ